MPTLEELRRTTSEVERYVDWSALDAERLLALAPLVTTSFPALVDDFYAEVKRHPLAAQTMTGGVEQVARLKDSLHRWLRELVSGDYGEAYAQSRARVGLRHVEIGLPQVFTGAALARLRAGLIRTLCERGHAAQIPVSELSQWVQSLNKRIDIDLALISAAYEAEYVRRQKKLERQSLEVLLHQQREFAEGVLAQLHAVVLVVDLEGRIVRLNPYLAKLAQRDADEVLGRHWLHVFSREQASSALFERLNTLVDPAVAATNLTITAGLPVADGSTRTLRWSGAVLRDTSGAPQAILLLGHDITDLVEAERKTLQAQRLATIGQVAAGLAHEVRNALQRIQACSEMLEFDLPAGGQAVDLVRRIQQAQTQMATLLNEVRSYAAPIQLELHRKKLSEAWREAWDQLAVARTGRTIELKEETDQVDLIIPFDQFRMSQVFRNLFENSLAACRDPVEITIRCAAVQVGGAPALRTWVKDNGPGLTPEQKRRIFEPFYTTKTKGTGLGMAIAQRIVESHGGALETGGGDANAQPNAGSAAAGPAIGAELVITLPRGAT